MTVAELIAVLQDRPPNAPVFVWEGDLACFLEVGTVSQPAEKFGKRDSTLPVGGVVIWGG